MNQREKLIELLCDFYYSDNACTNCEHNLETDYVCNQCITGHEVDYLLANGVVMLPCKVGDKVYRIPRSAIREYTVVYIGISADPFASYVNIAWYRDVHHFETLSVRFDEIGKTVFLTREEAEKALEKRKGGDE